MQNPGTFQCRQTLVFFDLETTGLGEFMRIAVTLYTVLNDN